MSDQAITPTQALAIAESLIKAARRAIEDGIDALPADTFSADTQAALVELRAAISAAG